MPIQRLTGFSARVNWAMTKGRGAPTNMMAIATIGGGENDVDGNKDSDGNGGSGGGSGGGDGGKYRLCWVEEEETSSGSWHGSPQRENN